MISKEEFLSIAETKYGDLAQLEKENNFYEYEKKFEQIMNELSRMLLESSISKVPDNRRKKKTLTRFGEIEIANSHSFSQGINGFQVSARMQEIMVYTGQLDSYNQGNEIIKEMLGVEVSATQHYRITDAYGVAAAEVVNESRTLAPLNKEEVLYVQADGSFILTRDEGWKEVKLGRFFKSGDCMELSEERGWIKHSQYVAHLGDCRSFTKSMDELIESYGSLGQRLVFISDGAVWLKNWMTDAFPKAVQILDFYHVLEYLHEFANAHFNSPAKLKLWIEKQKQLLLKSRVKQVLQNIRKLKTSEITALEKIINYYENNIERMDYASYLKLGAGIIGSGAIESAHRTVIQHRMKQAGQRWTSQGAQNMLNLRVIKENGQWNRIINVATHGFARAA